MHTHTHTYICGNNQCKKRSWIWKRARTGIWESLKRVKGREKWYNCITTTKKKGCIPNIASFTRYPPWLLHPQLESQYHSRSYQNLYHHIPPHLFKYLPLCIYSTNSCWISSMLHWAIWGHDLCLSSFTLDLNAALGRGCTHFIRLLHFKKGKMDPWILIVRNNKAHL